MIRRRHDIVITIENAFLLLLLNFFIFIAIIIIRRIIFECIFSHHFIREELSIDAISSLEGASVVHFINRVCSILNEEFILGDASSGVEVRVVAVRVVGLESRHSSSTTADEDSCFDKVEDRDENDEANDGADDDADRHRLRFFRSGGSESVGIVDGGGEGTERVRVVGGRAAGRILARDDGAGASDDAAAVIAGSDGGAEGCECSDVRGTVGFDGALDAVGGGGDGGTVAASSKHHDVGLERVVDDVAALIPGDGVNGGFRRQQLRGVDAVGGGDHVRDVGDGRGCDVVDVGGGVGRR